MWVQKNNGELVNLATAHRVYRTSEKVSLRGDADKYQHCLSAEFGWPNEGCHDVAQLACYESEQDARRVLAHIANGIGAGADLIELAGLEHCDPDDEPAEAVAADGWEPGEFPCPRCASQVGESRAAGAAVDCRCLSCGHSWRTAAALNQSKPDKG